MFGRRPSLATLLALVTAATLLPPMVLSLWMLDRVVAERRDDHTHQLAALAATLAGAVNREMRGWRETADVAAANPTLQTGGFREFHQWATALVDKAGGHFFVVDRKGRQLVNTRFPFERELPTFSAMTSVDRTFAAAGPVFTDLFVSKLSGQLVFDVVVPVIVEGEPTYALVFTPAVAYMQTLLDQHAIPSGWFAAIIDGNGRIVARSASPEVFVGRYSSTEFLRRLEGESGVLESVDLEGRPSLTAWHTSPLNGWRALAWAPRTVLDAPSRAAHMAGLATVAAGLLLAALSALLASRLIRRPVAATLVAAGAIARGEPVAIERQPMAEADAIAHALAEASRAIDARQSALTASEARLRHIADATPAMLWTATPDGRIWASERWRAYTGLDRTATLRGFAAALHPEDRDRVRAQWREALRTGTDFASEARVRRHDGAWRWFQTHAIAERDGAGHVVAWYGSTSDVDDLKRTEQSLRASEERLRLAQDIGGIGTIEWDMRRDRIVWSPVLADLARQIGLDRAMRADIEGQRGSEVLKAIFARVPATEAERLVAAHGATLAHGGMFSEEVAVRRQGEDVCWVHVRGEVFADADGPLRVLAVARDVTRRKHSEIETARFTIVADGSSEAIIGTDTAGRIEVWNKAAEQLYGWTAEEARGRPVSIIAEAGREAEVMANIARALRGEPTGPVDVVRRHRDGREVEVTTSIAPVRDASGRVVAVSASAHDISERKRQERRTRFVMRELSHRSKNLLAVVQAMARQTARTARSLDDFQSRFSERIDGLARSHDQLIAQEWRGAVLSELIRSQLMPFVGQDIGRLRLDGPCILLRPEAAQHIGLALHELATNASKHGALSVAGGRIEVSWTIGSATTDAGSEAATSGPALHMTWQERGGPQVAEPERRGFGRDVVERLAPSAVGGRASLAWDANGVAWRFEAPLSQVIGDDEPTGPEAHGGGVEFDLGTRAPELQALYRLWSERRGNARHPRPDALSGSTLMSHPRHFVLDFADGGDRRPRLVSVGEDLARLVGVDARQLSNAAMGPAAIKLLDVAMACRSHAEATGSPCYDRFEIEVTDGRRLAVEQLVAPLSEDGVTVSRLVGIVAVTK